MLATSPAPPSQKPVVNDMGKRSNFERIERDFYPTPYEAVIPLLPHLNDGIIAWEPCAGDGSLMRHLDYGMESKILFSGAIDIEPQSPDVEYGDGLIGNPPANTTHIITNTPWDRKILHPMIERFSAMHPTWLLFDADWMHTKQSSQYMKWCRKIVSVGRVKWIPDSKMTGKDNCAWYLFDKGSLGETVFYGRASDQ